MYDIMSRRKEDDGWFSSRFSSAFSVFSEFKWNTSVIELSEDQIGGGENKMVVKDT